MNILCNLLEQHKQISHISLQQAQKINCEQINMNFLFNKMTGKRVLIITQFFFFKRLNFQDEQEKEINSFKIGPVCCPLEKLVQNDHCYGHDDQLVQVVV